jgi:hypothetical protein
MERTLEITVREVVARTPVLDIHTHLYAPSFGMTLWGVDEILTYHYLVAEVIRFAPIGPAEFFAMPKPDQADLIWEHLFVRNTPISEATAGVCTIFEAFGLDPRARDLAEARALFAEFDPADHFSRVFELAGVESVVMTNDPFDDRERQHWEQGREPDSRFQAALRLDPLLNDWPLAERKMLDRGHREVGPFLEEWIERMRPLYAAVSLPPSFAYPED